MSAVPHSPVRRLTGGFFVLRGGPIGEGDSLGQGKVMREVEPSVPVYLAAPHKAFPICRTERQYRDLAYCVSQLPLTERGLRKMMDNFDCFGDKLSDESIFSAFLSVVGKLRRGAKPEGKVSSACWVRISSCSLQCSGALEVTTLLPYASPAGLQPHNQSNLRLDRSPIPVPPFLFFFFNKLFLEQF